MLRVIEIALNVLLLGVFILDYLDYVKMKRNEEELNRVKEEVRRMHYEICEIEDQLRVRMRV